jgi:inhibitor of KinA
MNDRESYTIFPLGDTAITIDLGNRIDEHINKQVISLFQLFKNKPFPGTTDVVPAYSSLTIYYDIMKIQTDGASTIFETVKRKVEETLRSATEINEPGAEIISIPVCYNPEFGKDIEWLATQKKLTADELIHLHTRRTYRVYMIGFLPGFAYMGEVDELLATSRKPQPEKVIAGSIGIAGKQTGIYPLNSPGGWQIIGQTPIKLFDLDKQEPVLLKAGDSVQFYPISKDEFKNY